MSTELITRNVLTRAPRPGKCAGRMKKRPGLLQHPAEEVVDIAPDRVGSRERRNHIRRLLRHDVVSLSD